MTRYELGGGLKDSIKLPKSNGVVVIGEWAVSEVELYVKRRCLAISGLDWDWPDLQDERRRQEALSECTMVWLAPARCKSTELNEIFRGMASWIIRNGKIFN